MSLYGSGPYGAGLYGVSEELGTGGAIDVWFELHRATVDNQLVEDLSDLLTDGYVDLNHDRAITTQATLHVRDAARVAPYTDYLAVFMCRAYDDGRPPERDQLGLFTVRVPKGTRSVQKGEGVYTGHDLTAVLGRYAFTDTYNIPAGTNYVTAVTDILVLAGITRHAIPPTAQTLATPRSYALGTTYLEACNDLLSAVGYYHLAATTDGRLTSGPTSDIRYVTPYRVLTDADIMSDIETQTTDTTVANIVIVVQDNFNAEPLTATRRNDDPDSPSSTVNLGPITRVEVRSNLADQAAVDALADRLMSEGRTWYQVASWKMLPDPDVLTPHQTVDLVLTGKQAIFSGLWWLRTARIGFDPRSAGPVIECNRVTDTIEGRLI